MEPVRVQFTWLQTGEEARVSYRCPFSNDWNWSSYARQIDGTIYVERNRCEKDFEIADGMPKAYHGLGGDVVIPDAVREISAY